MARRSARRAISVIENLGAYGVRYLFVTCGFLVAETENLRRQFLLRRAPEARGPNLFDIAGNAERKTRRFLTLSTVHLVGRSHSFQGRETGRIHEVAIDAIYKRSVRLGFRLNLLPFGVGLKSSPVLLGFPATRVLEDVNE